MKNMHAYMMWTESKNSEKMQKYWSWWMRMNTFSNASRRVIHSNCIHSLFPSLQADDKCKCVDTTFFSRKRIVIPPRLHFQPGNHYSSLWISEYHLRSSVNALEIMGWSFWMIDGSPLHDWPFSGFLFIFGITLNSLEIWLFFTITLV